MKRMLIALVLALALGAMSFAKTPKEVLEPYKAYRAALAEKDNDLAAHKAFEAWQNAEKLMGDNKTTGDLAVNFAELNPSYLNEKTAWKHIIKAYQRAIDLSATYKEDPAEVEIDRRTKYLTWLVSNVSKQSSRGWERDYGPKKLNERIQELGLAGSTFDAESMAFSAQIAMHDRKWKDTERDSKAAIALFESRTDGIFSVYEYAVPIYLARAYSETDRNVDAALTYQALMTKLDEKGGHNNAFSADAYGEWLRLRDEIIEEKDPHPRASEVIDFLVPAGRTEELAPLIRRPPTFPTNFLNGNKSGFVKIKFNVDINGHVIDPIIISSTTKSLHKAALDCLEDWRYTPNLPDARSQDVETTIRFNLIGPNGRRLRDGEEKKR